MEQHPPTVDQERLARIRQARQVLAGHEIPPPGQEGQATARPNRHGPAALLDSSEVRYFLLLAVLVLLSALVWAIWGTAPASPILFVLAIALLLAWFIL